MARPTKNYCDYFPHDRDMRNHRKIKSIRTKFGIAGYGIWCMTLEYLTGIDGNVVEYNDTELELMSGDYGVSATEIRNVLDYCIRLELLFIKDGFLHSESLDERLKPVYEKRGVSKSNSKKQLRNNGQFAGNNADDTVVSGAEMPQSKVKGIKVNRSKGKSAIALATEAEKENQKTLKTEYETLTTDLAGKDSREVYKAIRDFVAIKKPNFAEPFVDAWNIFAPSNNLESVQEISKDRRDKIRIRTREPAFDFFKILGSIRQNSFYRGENSSNWKIDFNYVIHSEKNYIKLIEKYKENGSH